MRTEIMWVKEMDKVRDSNNGEGKYQVTHG